MSVTLVIFSSSMCASGAHAMLGCEHTREVNPMKRRPIEAQFFGVALPYLAGQHDTASDRV